MASNPINAALSLDGLQTADARAGFDVAAGSGFGGIAFATNHPELNPEALGPSALRHVRTILVGKQLTVHAIRAAAPRGGLGNSATIDRTIDNARRAMQLARDMGVQTVSLNAGNLAGGVPESTIVAALRELSQQADAAGVSLAVAADDLDKLPDLLKQVDFEKARIHLEGTRLISHSGDPLVTAESLAGMVGQFTAADAVRAGKALRTVPLGEGQLPMEELLHLLQGHDFRGPLVVDVRDLPNGASGAQHAAEVLRRLMQKR